MNLLAKLLAHALFAVQRPWVFVRQNRTLLSLFAVTAVATVFATLGATVLLDRRHLWPTGARDVCDELGDASAQGTFITANGTTAQDWSIGGPSGPIWVNEAGTSTISAAVAMRVDSLSEVDIGNSTNEPTINIGDQSASSNNQINIGSVLNSTDVIIAGGPGGFASASVQFESTNFNLTGNSSTDNLILGSGNNTATLAPNTLTIQGGTTQPGILLTATGDPTISLNGVGFVTASDQLYLNATAAGTTPAVALSVDGQTIISAQESGLTIGMGVGGPIACGTGGTHVIPVQTVGIVVTTGTLASNCVLNFATNASTGYYAVDLSGATLGATFGVEFENGTATYTATTTNHTSGATLAHVWTHGTNTLVVSY